MMRTLRIAFYSLCLLAFSTVTYADQDVESHHLPVSLDSSQVENLFVLGKVWGYLKYHHSMVTQGCLNWDAELLTRLPSFLQDHDTALANLNAWVEELDGVDQISRCSKPSGDIAYIGTSEWTADTELLGSEMSNRLTGLERKELANTLQHYVSVQNGVGNPVFQNELSYESISDLDWRYRILALYRFWNIVEYWAPYRELIGPKFDEVLKTFIPKFYAATEEDEYISTLMLLTATVQDGHTNLWSAIQARPPVGPARSPLVVRYVEGRPLVWKRLSQMPTDIDEGGYDVQSLQVGDVIIAIDGVSIEDLVDDWFPFYGSSNDSAFYRDVATNMLRGDAGLFHLVVERDGEVLQVTSNRIASDQLNLQQGLVHDLEGETIQEVGDEIPYVKLSTIDAEDVETIVNLAKNAGALILDLRGYPKSFMVFSIGQHLVDKQTQFARFTIADMSRPATFRWTEPVSLEPKEPTVKGKFVILVDEQTQSQAEYTAMAFQAAPGAIVIGSQTAGADGNVSHIELPGGHRTMISGIGVYYPNKKPTQQVGIVLDIEVLPTMSGLRAGKDEVLEAAIQYIHSSSELD